MRHITLVLIYSFLLVVLGCASHKEVASSESNVRTQYIHLTDTLLCHDSAYVHDSVFVTMRGDTFLQYKWRTEFRDRIVYRNHTDTVCNTDTLTKVVVQTKQVERKQTFIQKASSIIGTITVSLLLVALLAYAIRRFIS